MTGASVLNQVSTRQRALCRQPTNGGSGLLFLRWKGLESAGDRSGDPRCERGDYGRCGRGSLGHSVSQQWAEATAPALRRCY